MFGIAFIVFAGLAAIINYELNKLQYPGAPTSFIELSFLTAMLPFLVSAVLSFAVAFFASRTIKSEAEEETEKQKTETQAKQEAHLEATLT